MAALVRLVEYYFVDCYYRFRVSRYEKLRSLHELDKFVRNKYVTVSSDS